MIPKSLIKHLEESGLKYETVEHRKVYTAHDAAATMKVKLPQIAKSLLVKFNKPFINNQKPYALVIVGADKNIDLNKLKKVVSDWAVKKNKELRLLKPEKGKKPMVDVYNKVAKVVIPKEKDLKEKLKIKPGAASAFGKMYKLPVFVDKGFLKNKDGIFSSGSFTESIKMGVKKYTELEEAMDGNFALAKKIKKTKSKVKK